MDKKKILGIPIALFVIGVLVIGGATAALVSYLSNSITATTVVQSPMVLKVSTDGTTFSDSVNLGTANGGESKDVYVQTQNRANVAITGTMYNIINNPAGVTCADFTSITGTVTFSQPTASGPFPSTVTCAVINSTNVKLISTPTTPWTWQAGNLDVAHITLTFNQAASGSYLLTTQVIV